MPGFDGTGPLGTGPVGRGLGPCGGGGAWGARGFGRGAGNWRQGRGWSAGAGWGRFGGGRGGGRWAWRNNEAMPSDEPADRASLLSEMKRRLESMEQGVAMLKSEIESLAAPEREEKE